MQAYSHTQSGPVSIPQPQQIRTSVVLLQYTGGFIGMFSTGRNLLEMKINEFNGTGFRLRHVLPAKLSILTAWLSLLLLCLTLGIWTKVPGETLIFEKVG